MNSASWSKTVLEAKIEGFITYVTQSGSLTINNHPINVSSSTTFEGGTANELVLGTQCVVSYGILLEAVCWVLSKIIFKEDIQMELNVESIDLQARNS